MKKLTINEVQKVSGAENWDLEGGETKSWPSGGYYTIKVNTLVGGSNNMFISCGLYPVVKVGVGVYGCGPYKMLKIRCNANFCYGETLEN